MKRMKRVLILTAMISGAFTAGVYAQDVLQRVEAYLRPDFNLMLDGKPVALSGPTLVYEGSSYLPLAELARLLGANILWKGDTKTIYINSRINPEQRNDEGNQQYEKIQMLSPYSMTLSYLGTEYPMLVTNNDSRSSFSYDLYYRLSDVKRMGINTDGLKKAEERITGELFVSEKELQKLWGRKPAQVYSPTGESYVISGEIHPRKLEALRTHIKTTLNVKMGELHLFDKPIIVDKVQDEEDSYDYLFQETVRLPNGTSTNRYFRAGLKLRKETIGSETVYTVNMATKTDLQTEAEKRENP